MIRLPVPKGRRRVGGFPEGRINEKVAVMEVTTAIKRAGADLILTYYAMQLADWIKEGDPF